MDLRTLEFIGIRHVYSAGQLRATTVSSRHVGPGQAQFGAAYRDLRVPWDILIHIVGSTVEHLDGCGLELKDAASSPMRIRPPQLAGPAFGLGRRRAQSKDRPGLCLLGDQIPEIDLAGGHRSTLFKKANIVRR